MVSAVSASLALFAIPFSIVAAFLIAVLVPAGQSATVHNHQELRAAGYGYPRPWFHQDLTMRADPVSYPDYEPWQNPQEVPTSIDGGAFLVDWAVIATVLAAVLLIVAGLIRLAGGAIQQRYRGVDLPTATPSVG